MRGIYFKTNPYRSGYIKDIYIDNFILGKVEDAFNISSNYHGEGKGHNSDVSNIFIDKVTCEEATGIGIVIQGFAESKVKNVELKNISIAKAFNGLSTTNTEHVVFDNVIIGEEAGVPTAVGKKLQE